jgi:hypothetical protein
VGGRAGEEGLDPQESTGTISQYQSVANSPLYNSDGIETMPGYLTGDLVLCRKEKPAIKRKDETNVVLLYLPLVVPRLVCWNQLAPLHFGAAGKL